MSKNAVNRSYVFIVTYGRSGSTTLQTLLQSIPGYHITGENFNCLSALYSAVQLATTARFQHGKNDHDAIDPWFGANHIDPDQFGARLVRAFEDEIMRPPADARVAGFKEIRFHEVGAENFESFLNFMHQHFSPCKFVFNTRGWREIVRSGWWQNQRPERVEEIIRGADQMYHDYLTKYPERGILLCHEQTREDPAAFQPLFEFLGEDFDLKKVSEIAGRRLGHSGV
ncbi:sulfotransferase [Kordiimonas aquimaris]|uniref:sulfotransferase n=1 Tax=Kordiimonas aquimaris TaxID=707591 RepID=UPI0021CEAE0F|nr:sulfotransferase [Kordiimonas aquimaris]